MRLLTRVYGIVLISCLVYYVKYIYDAYMHLLLVQVCSYGFTECLGDNMLLLRFNICQGLSNVHNVFLVSAEHKG